MKDDATIEWVRPSGRKIKTNNWKSTIEYAESLDWKRSDEVPKKRGRPAKTEEAE